MLDRTPMLSSLRLMVQGPSEGSKQLLQKGVLTGPDGTSIRLSADDVKQVEHEFVLLAAVYTCRCRH